MTDLTVKDAQGNWHFNFNNQPGIWDSNFGVVKVGNPNWAPVDVGHQYNDALGSSTHTVYVP